MSHNFKLVVFAASTIDKDELAHVVQPRLESLRDFTPELPDQKGAEYRDVSDLFQHAYDNGVIEAFELADGALVSPWDPETREYHAHYVRDLTAAEHKAVQAYRTDNRTSIVLEALLNRGIARFPKDGTQYLVWNGQDKVLVLPPGAKKVENVPVASVLTLLDFIKLEEMPILKHGEEPDTNPEKPSSLAYAQLDEAGQFKALYRRTIPGFKYDDYGIGGAYKSYLIPTHEELEKRGYPDLKLGEDSITMYRGPIMRKREIDFAAVQKVTEDSRRQALINTLEHLESEHGLSQTSALLVWATYIGAGGFSAVEAAHTEAGVGKEVDVRQWALSLEGEVDNAAVSAFRTAVTSGVYDAFVVDHENRLVGMGVGEDFADPFDWVKAAPAFSSFALLDKDDNWYQRAETPVNLEKVEPKTEKEWTQFLQSKLDALDDDDWVIVIDCE